MKKKYITPMLFAASVRYASDSACGKYSACGELVRGR